MYVVDSSPSQPTILNVYLPTSRGVPNHARAVWSAVRHRCPPCNTGTSMCLFQLAVLFELLLLYVWYEHKNSFAGELHQQVVTTIQTHPELGRFVRERPHTLEFLGQIPLFERFLRGSAAQPLALPYCSVPGRERTGLKATTRSGYDFVFWTVLSNLSLGFDVRRGWKKKKYIGKHFKIGLLFFPDNALFLAASKRFPHRPIVLLMCCCLTIDPQGPPIQLLTMACS